MSRHRTVIIAFCIIIFGLLCNGCDLLERGLSSSLPYTLHKLGLEEYRFGSEELPAEAASLMPELTDYPEALSITYQYDAKTDLIDQATCSYLTLQFEPQGYDACKKAIAQAESHCQEAYPLQSYLPARDRELKPVDFVHGDYLFPAAYLAEQSIGEASYLRLIGFDDEAHSVLYLYLSMGGSAASMGADGLLDLDFFQNYPW